MRRDRRARSHPDGGDRPGRPPRGAGPCRDGVHRGGGGMHDEEESLYADVPRREPAGMSGPRVVVAVDGSAGSRAALRFALEDATRRGVPVDAVIAFRGPEMWVDFNGVGSHEVERLRSTLRSQQEDKVRAVVDEVAGGSAGPLPEVR